MSTTPEWAIVPLTENHGIEICGWIYPAPFDLYKQAEFTDPAIRESQYAGVVDSSESLCGFVQFFPLVGVTRLGLGLRPDLVGQGNGPHLLRLAVKEAKKRAPGNEIDLEVLVWNERAIKAYTKAGFTITDTYVKGTASGPAEFHCMVYQEEGENV